MKKFPALKGTPNYIATFGDDTAFYAIGKNLDKIVRILSESAQYLSEYCFKLKIKLNYTKTLWSVLHQNRNQRWLPLPNQIKYFGVSYGQNILVKAYLYPGKDLAIPRVA